MIIFIFKINWYLYTKNRWHLSYQPVWKVFLWSVPEHLLFLEIQLIFPTHLSRIKLVDWFSHFQAIHPNYSVLHHSAISSSNSIPPSKIISLQNRLLYLKTVCFEGFSALFCVIVPFSEIATKRYNNSACSASCFPLEISNNPAFPLREADP